MKRNNNVIGPPQINSSTSNIGVFDRFDQYLNIKGGRWQPPVKFLSTSQNKTSLNPGSTVTFTVFVEGLADGSTVYFSTQSLNGTISTSDFTDSSVTGSATVAGGQVVINRTSAFAGTAVFPDAFRLNIRTESISGPIVISTDSVTMNQATITIVPNLSQPYAATEGDTVSYSVTTTFVDDGTVLYWQSANYINPAQEDLTTDIPYSTFTITSSAGSFSLPIRRDMLTEGTENFILTVRSQGYGTILATAPAVPITDLSQTPVITANTATVSEGSSVKFDVATTGLLNGTPLYWSVRSARASAQDFSTSMSGTMTTGAGGAANVTITTIADILTEGVAANLLLAGDGTNGSTSIIDTSPNAYTITRNGNPLISTAQSKWGGSSIIFDGSSSLSLPNNVGLSQTSNQVGNGFTIEAWVWIDSTIAASGFGGNKTIVFFEASYNYSSYPYYDEKFLITGDATNAGTGLGWWNPSYYGNYTINATIPKNQWVHIAFTRTGTVDGDYTIYGYVNGTRYYITNVGSWNSGGNAQVPNYVGGNPLGTDNGYMKGYIDDFRILNFGLYTGSTITVPSGAFDGLGTTVPVNESFFLQLRRDPNGQTGTIVANSAVITITDSSISPTVSANTTSINEGDSVLFTVNTTGVTNGTILYWTFGTTGGGAVFPTDFVGGVTSGTLTITSNQATLTKQWAADTKTEGTEVFVLQIRTLSTSGVIVATSPGISVGDTSTGTPEFSLPAFPVTNSQLQWYFSPDVIATGTYANTVTFDTSGAIGVSQSVATWKTFGTTGITIGSYTRLSNSTQRKYASIPLNAYFATTADTFNATAMDTSATPAMTLFGTIRSNWTTQNDIVRIFGTGIGTSSTPFTSMTSNDWNTSWLFRMGTNGGSNLFWWIQAPGNTAGGYNYNYNYNGAWSVYNNPNIIVAFAVTTNVKSQQSGGADIAPYNNFMAIRARDTTTNATINTDQAPANWFYGWSGGGWNYNASTPTVGRPCIGNQSYIYNEGNPLHVVELGWANRLYSNTEINSVLSWMVTNNT